MGEKKFLALSLAAPFQSWGCSSKFGHRATLDFPTRSGVIGLLCAAAGVDRKDRAGLERINRVSVSVYTFRQGTRMTDYHTIGGGYDRQTHPLNISPKADGSGGDTVLTERDYLQSSRFGAVIGGPADVIGELAEALKNPKWGIWFGRKCCIPTEPVFIAAADGEAEAVDALRERDRETGRNGEFVQIVRKAESFDDGNDTLMDEPLDFSARTFGNRRILKIRTGKG